MKKRYLLIALMALGLMTLPASPVAAQPADQCRSNADCEATSYCEKPEHACKAVGTCEPRPDVCAQVIDPVCGCDGQTYNNSCEAAMAGVNVYKDGECASCDRKQGQCGSNAECGAGYFCQRDVGECYECGTCEVQPELCTQQFDPVCGCDGQTYSNLCTAYSNGVSVAYEGECTS